MMFSKLSHVFVIVALGATVQVTAVPGAIALPHSHVTSSHGGVYSTATETVGANKLGCVNINTKGQRTRNCCLKNLFSDGVLMTCFDSKSKKFHPINKITCAFKGASGSCGDGVTNPKINVKFDLSDPDTPGSVVPFIGNV